MNDRHLTDKSVFNIFWSFVSFAGSKLINLVAIIILARYLDPTEFGLMAICVVIMTYFEIVARFGLGQALISRVDDVEAAKEATFFFSLAISSALCAAVWLSAEPISNFFGQPGLAQYLPILSFGMVIQSLTTVHLNMLGKNLKFRRKAVPDLVQGSVKALVSIGLALAGYGIWSLILGYLTGAVVEAFVRFAMYPWWPKRMPRLNVGGQMAGFGVFLLAAECINALQRTLDVLMIGKLLGPAAAGLYSQAFKIPDLAIRSVNQVAGVVIHPVMSSIQTDMDAVRRYYYACLRYVALFAFPAAAAIAVTADPLVRMLYTPEWITMIGPMQSLSIAVGLMTIDFLPGVIYKAINKPRYMLMISVVKLPFFVLTIWYFTRIGVQAVSTAQIGLSIFYMFLNLTLMRHVVRIDPRRYFGALAPGAVTALAVAAAGLAARQVGIGHPALETLFLLAGMSLAALACVRVVSPEVFIEVRRMITSKLQKKRKAGLPAE